MLCELRIRNVALVEAQELRFGPGFTVLSGETGAGKSIILDALGLILGARARADLVRSGASSATVEALFSLSGLSPLVRSSLPEIVAPEDEELVVSREVSAEGRSRVMINGRLASVSLLGEVAGKLVNVCGQNEHVRLLTPAVHLQLLDAFGRHAELLVRYRGAFQEWRAAQTELSAIEQRLSQGVLRRAELQGMVEELAAVNLRPGVRAELEEKVRTLNNRVRIEEGLTRASQLIQDGESSLGAALHRLQAEFHAISKFSDLGRAGQSLCQGLAAQLEETEQFVARELAGLGDAGGAEELRGALAEVARLERKYKTNDSGLLQLLQEAQLELSRIDAALDIDTLRARVAGLLQQLERVGRELSEARSFAAARLAKGLERELSDLQMKGVHVRLAFNPHPPTEDGFEAGEFLVALNRGESERPLRSVASGGELSRITLVLQKLLGQGQDASDDGQVSVLVFDEVDSGISGGVARAVGEKLRAISRGSQVICVTHLPQVASLADAHFLVEKQQGKRNITVVRALQGEARVEEIARMLAGYEVTAASRESARELISSK